jgi:hypothetical protein
MQSSRVAFFPFSQAVKLTCFPVTIARMTPSNEPENEKRFFPSGAIFFFVLLLLFYAAIWFLIYWIMIARS